MPGRLPSRASDVRPLHVCLQMKLPSKPMAAQPAAATVTLDTFLHNFSVPKLMDKIADLEQHNLRAKIAAMSRPQNQQPAQQQKSASAVAFIQDLQLVDKLLVSFQRHAPPRLAYPRVHYWPVFLCQLPEACPSQTGVPSICTASGNSLKRHSFCQASGWADLDARDMRLPA